MTAYDRLKTLLAIFNDRRDATDCDTAFDCIIHIANAETNATDTLGHDAINTDAWCNLVIATIESQLEVAEPHVHVAFNDLGYSH
jgi:hypothetical protein